MDLVHTKVELIVCGEHCATPFLDVINLRN